MNKTKLILGAVAVLAIAFGFQMMKARHAAPLAASGECAVDAPGAAACSAAGTAVPGTPKSEQVFSSQASAARTESESVSVSDQRQLQILNEVLVARNDNDPRLDHELRVLSPSARRLMRARYDELAAEKRNERGTIVFLVGRNLEAAQDFQFLSGVVNEAPCRSLKDCQAADAMDSRDSTGSEMGIDVTLNYPQIVALKSLERLLSGAPSADQRAHAIRVIREAMGSPVRAISRMATDLYNRYGGKSS